MRGGGASPLIRYRAGHGQPLDCTYSVTEAIVIGMTGMWSLPTSTDVGGVVLCGDRGDGQPRRYLGGCRAGYQQIENLVLPRGECSQQLPAGLVVVDEPDGGFLPGSDGDFAGRSAPPGRPGGSGGAGPASSR